MKTSILLMLIIIVLVIISGGYYLISPAFKTIEVNEDLPIVNDAMNSMSEQEKAEFDLAVGAMSDTQIEMSETTPSNAQIVSVLAQGNFKPRAHEVEGRALLIKADNQKIIRFEDFETINGPNLHIYLSNELGDSDFIDLGKIKATKGNVNYEIPSGVNTDKYNKVLVWCVPFKVLFSYAELE